LNRDPTGITAVEKRAVLDSAERAGSASRVPVETRMAAAIGRDCASRSDREHDHRHRRGNDGSSRYLAGRHQRLRIGSASPVTTSTTPIVNHIEETYNMAIASRCRGIKIDIGKRRPHGRQRAVDGVRGRDIDLGLPRKTL